MHRYETLFVLHPEIPEAQVRETMDRVRRLIEGMDGQVAEVQDWGIRELAYPIRKQPRGTYVLAQYSARPDVVKELERTLKLADEVLRFISVRAPQPRKATRRGTRQPRPVTPTEQSPASAAEQGS
ncbi:MAG TPA: 30S ribosomal protein S6 [Candidatus Margulisiibacteriota bacterium]|nr:30S ribosomal protein S6 [Candidatus Margulisiibacteriota bacterium]